MKHVLLLIVAILLFGCTNDSTNDLIYKYRLLKLNMTVDQIRDVVGTPDMILPEVIGQTWVFKDDQSVSRIALYVSPQMKWEIPKTSLTPRLQIDTGRLVHKQWLDDRAGES